jgi:hypothetical protein
MKPWMIIALLVCAAIVGYVEKDVNDARIAAMAACHTDTECEAADGGEY